MPETTSIWSRDFQMPNLQELAEDLEVDVCIIGAGFAGLSTAYMLLKENRSVAVLDDGLIGGGESCRTTAHLSNAIDDRYTEIERIHGLEGARLAAQAHTMAIDRIEQICRQEEIECEFERLDGYLIAGPGQKIDVLEREMAAAHRAGLAEVTLSPLPMLGHMAPQTCLKFPRQGQLHPTRYLAGLASAIRKIGGRILRAHAKADFSGDGQLLVRTLQGPTLSARSVVVATNSPISDRVTIHTKQAPYRTYVIAARVPKGSIEKALYWDNIDPYHYIRLHSPAGDEGFDIAIIGGEDHKTGHDQRPQKRWQDLEDWARRELGVIEEVVERWSGQVMETNDGLAYIGRDPANKDVYIATGDSGMGTTHGMIAGMLLSDLIANQSSPWEELFEPQRIRVSAGTEFLRENIDVAANYGKWLTGGETSDVGDIEPDSGAIIRSGLKKIAVYRDPQGHLHQMSAVCPHLGCVLSWNQAEKHWECPCHGSRFTATGKVVNGPANTDLQPAPEKSRVGETKPD